MSTKKDAAVPVYKFSPEKAERIEMENIDIVLNQTIVLFDGLKEDKRSNQGKAQFILTIIGAAIALLIAELVAENHGHWVVRAFVGIEAVVLCFIGAMLVKLCLLPSKWFSRGLSISKVWEHDKVPKYSPKAFKVFLAKQFEVAINENTENNQKSAAWLVTFTLAAFLSPIITGFLVFVVWCLASLCSP